MAAVIFLGRYAFRSLGAARTAAILSRLFWVCYAGWAVVVWYGAVWMPLHSYTTGHYTAADIDWKATAPFTPPPLSSYKGDAPQDQSSGVMGRARTNEFGDVAVADQPRAKQPSSAAASDPGDWKVVPEPASSEHLPHLPVNWGLAFSLLGAPLLLWVAVIFIATGRPVWRARQS
jgi:hypothetical protein